MLPAQNRLNAKKLWILLQCSKNVEWSNDAKASNNRIPGTWLEPDTFLGTVWTPIFSFKAMLKHAFSLILQTLKSYIASVRENKPCWNGSNRRCNRSNSVSTPALVHLLNKIFPWLFNLFFWFYSIRWGDLLELTLIMFCRTSSLMTALWHAVFW